jgi:hypothetical protein
MVELSAVTARPKRAYAPGERRRTMVDWVEFAIALMLLGAAIIDKMPPRGPGNEE